MIPSSGEGQASAATPLSSHFACASSYAWSHLTFGSYVPEGQFCNFSIFIRQTLGTVMLHAGDLLISRVCTRTTAGLLIPRRPP